jgi:hypothetical protein
MSYDPNRTADIYAYVEPAPAKEKHNPPTSEERLAEIRQRTIALSKQSSALSGFPQPHANYYTDFAGSETSHWDFSHVCYLLDLLEEPKFQGLWSREDDGHFSATDATWSLRENAPPMKFALGVTTPPNFATLAELKAALGARIAELKISPVMIFEWLAVSHSIADSQAFDRLSFKEKMRTFRQGES